VGASTLPTTFRFTGQRQESFGLYFYQSRWYDPLLGRFAQADSVIPNP
jgi:RHS repeat-associated protein